MKKPLTFCIYLVLLLFSVCPSFPQTASEAKPSVESLLIGKWEFKHFQIRSGQILFLQGTVSYHPNQTFTESIHIFSLSFWGVALLPNTQIKGVWLYDWQDKELHQHRTEVVSPKKQLNTWEQTLLEKLKGKTYEKLQMLNGDQLLMGNRYQRIK